MGFKVDFSNVQNFDPIPAGAYPVIITNVEQKQKQGSEYPYLNWTLCITEGEFENRNLWAITSLNPKAFFKLQELMEACGVNEEALKSSEFDLEPEEYIGSSIVAVVSQRTYEGKIQNSVDNFLSLDQPSPGRGKVATSSGPVKGKGGPRIK